MSQILGVVSAEPVIHGVLKILWNDGYAGIVDFRHLLARRLIGSWRYWQT